MDNFEEKLIELSSVEFDSPDIDSFIRNIRLYQNDMRIKRNRAISGLSAFVFILIMGIFTAIQLDDTYYMHGQWTSADSYLIYDYLSNIDDNQDWEIDELDQLTLYLLEQGYELDSEEIFYYSTLYDETNYKEKSL